MLPDAERLTGSRATETALKGVHSPRVLHVATHGFFLPELHTGEQKPCTRGVAPVRLSITPEQANPLLLAGIAMAGANGGAGDDEDGVLTALEAASLDLSGTKLVVLSACETGLGEVRNGQGVHGLRRAFAIAGAETQVMSLWKVDDEATRELMVGYYQRLARGRGRVAAMRDVQLGMLADPKRSHPFYWAAFIVSGDGAPLDLGQLRAPPSSPPARGCGCELAAPSPTGWWLALAAAFGFAWRRSRSRHISSKNSSVPM
jgi:MYXO-CTERM domain-containing protein